jgi:two-component system chemotaxis response regulator CheY
MSIKILGVDDSPTIRRLLKTATTQFVVDPIFLEAENGLHALEVLEENPDIKLIFLDINMPRMNGREFLESIRSQDRFNHIKVIIQTTETDRNVAKSLMELGISGYVIKPYTMETMKKLFIKLSESIGFSMQ